MPDYLLFADSSTSIQLEPEYGFENRHSKIQSTLRTQDGGLKQYKFGEFPAFSVPVKFVNSSDRYQIHEWWNDNTDLVFEWHGSDYNVRITNRREPLNKNTKPYNSLFEGKIELEGY